MLKDTSRAQLAGMWFAAIIAVGACSVFLGAALTVSNGELLLAACVAPPAVMLLVWRGAPPVTVAELLYSVDRPSTDARS